MSEVKQDVGQRGSPAPVLLLGSQIPDPEHPDELDERNQQTNTGYSAGHHGQDSRREYSLPEYRGALRQDTGAGAEEDHLLVLSSEREGHLHVFLVIEGSVSWGAAESVVLQRTEAAGVGMRRERVASW